MSSEARDAGIFVYSRLAASVLGLLVLVVGTQLYDETEFGYLSALVLLQTAAIALGSLGLADAVYYFVGKDRASAADLARQTTFLLAAVTPAVVVIIWIAGAAFSHKVDVSDALPWLALVIALELPTQPAINQLIATGHARLASGIYIGLMAMKVVAVLLPGALGLSVSVIPVFMAVAAVIRLVVYLAIVRAYFPRARSGGWYDRARLREILAFSLPVGAAALAGTLNPQIDKYAIGWSYGKPGLGMYAVASIELPLITLVPYAIGAVMQRRYVERYLAGDLVGLHALWTGTVRKISLIVAPLVIVVVVLAEHALALFGARYIAATVPFQVFTLGLLHRIAAYGPMLQAVGRPRVIMIGAIAMVVMNAILCYPFIQLFGFSGAAIAAVTSMLVGWLFLISQIGDALGVGLRGVLPWRHYAAVLALAVPLGGGLWLVIEQLPWSHGALVGFGLPAYLILYVALARAVGLMSATDARYLRDWLTLKLLRDRR